MTTRLAPNPCLTASSDTAVGPTTRRPRQRRSPGRTAPPQPRGTAPLRTAGTRHGIDTDLAERSGTSTVVAFGDVHGCASLLERELERHYDSGAELIFLGDLIDRSPEPDGDRRVLERIWALQANPGLWGLAGVTVLRGNHEQMLLDTLEERLRLQEALAGAEPDEDGLFGEASDHWMWNGGRAEMLEWLMPHRDWFASLPYTAIRGSYLFVHAGIKPGVPLEQQTSEDLTWIRRPFLNRHHGLPYTVVHGHSITRGHRIENHGHRINLDTGAFMSGVLSSMAFEIGS